ncbi:uncharacterized protein LOC141649940 [Silene latifolia]|uniref:uncharacterized protein LOC141649940 n=1 Tax=Silene latifolia TaxID=37657 RepID=UPI003D77BD4E
MVNEKVRSKHKRTKNILLLDYLQDELLVEILCRLPDYKNDVTCKAFCKRWASLISRPFFIRQFVDDKVSKNCRAPYINGYSEYDDEERMKMTNDRTFGLVVLKLDTPRRYSLENTGKGLIIRFKDPVHKPRNVSVSSLPKLLYSLPHASCNDFCSYFIIDRKYYFRCDKYIIGFDPFVDGNDVIKCDSLPLPLSDMMDQISIFGVFHKRLYMCVGDESEGTYRVWALEDFKKGFWSLQHSITVQDWTPRNRRLVRLIFRESHTGKPISFHPTNPDIIYTISRRWIILCNLRTREIEIVSELPEGYQDVFPAVDSYEFTLPVWPSPLPILGI